MALVLGSIIAAAAAILAAQSAEDVADLVGARAAGGETQLEARGYRFVTVNTVRDTKWSFWWSDRQRQCISVATTDGRYATINRVPAANCNASAAPGYDRETADRSPRGEAITLICYGAGSAPAAQTYSGYRYSTKSGRFEPEMGTRLGREGFASDVQLELAGGSGRIHLSGKLVSPIHSGGVDGWWQIENLVVTPDRITGQYRLNGLNKPRFEVDRRNGRITIRAATEFVGECHAGDWRSNAF